METGFLGPQLVSSWKSARWLGTAHRRWGLQGGERVSSRTVRAPARAGRPGWPECESCGQNWNLRAGAGRGSGTKTRVGYSIFETGEGIGLWGGWEAAVETAEADGLPGMRVRGGRGGKAGSPLSCPSTPGNLGAQIREGRGRRRSSRLGPWEKVVWLSL